MNTQLLTINPQEEAAKILAFLRKVQKEQSTKAFVIGLSGGIDSTTVFYLLKEAFPLKQIIVARLSYFSHQTDVTDQLITKLNLPKNNINQLSIKPLVDAAAKTAGITNSTREGKLRLGNIMARSRMILLYDLAKKHNALVVGTENKSEMLLGYFTRFGDEASDIEPIQHLYKTQVYQLAKYLQIPDLIINQAPTAGLWKGQTDEMQLGFTYAEADEVLYWYTEKKLSLDMITNKGYPLAKKIITHMQKNEFKHHVPYLLK
jgi:NAD+ synthase